MQYNWPCSRGVEDDLACRQPRTLWKRGRQALPHAGETANNHPPPTDSQVRCSGNEPRTTQDHLSSGSSPTPHNEKPLPAATPDCVAEVEAINRCPDGSGGKASRASLIAQLHLHYSTSRAKSQTCRLARRRLSASSFRASASSVTTTSAPTPSTIGAVRFFRLAASSPENPFLKELTVRPAAPLMGTQRQRLDLLRLYAGQAPMQSNILFPSPFVSPQSCQWEKNRA